MKSLLVELTASGRHAILISTHDVETIPRHCNRAVFLANAQVTRPWERGPDRILAGGYEPSFIDATIRYVEAMNEDVTEPEIWNQTLSEAVGQDVKSGALIYIPAYEEVHASNIALLKAYRGKA